MRTDRSRGRQPILLTSHNTEAVLWVLAVDVVKNFGKLLNEFALPIQNRSDLVEDNVMTHSHGIRYEILTVRSITQTGRDQTLTFEGGLVGTLSPAHADSKYWLTLATQSLERGQPIGISLDQRNQITAVGFADLDVPRKIVEDTVYKERKKLWFWRHAAIHALPMSHPDYDRIVATLQEAIDAKQEVWVAALPYAIILDVRSKEEVAVASLDERPSPTQP